MGGDGGSIPGRRELVEMYEADKADAIDPALAALTRWTSCTLSQQPLQPPVAADRLGNMYNKDALLDRLLSKSLPEEMSHIRKLKDIVQLKLTERTDTDAADSEVRYMCPITLKPMNGGSKFVFLETCGCVLAAQALSEIPGTDCLVCGKAFTPEGVITINGSEEEVEELRQRLAAKKQAKKDKKKKSKASSTTAGPSEPPPTTTTTTTTTTTKPETTNSEKGVNGEGETGKDGKKKDKGKGVSIGAGALAAAAQAASKGKRKRSDSETDGKVGTSDPPAAKRSKAGSPSNASNISFAIPGIQEKIQEAKEKAKSKTKEGSEVYKKLFVSNREGPVEETFLCRSTSNTSAHGR